MRAAGLGDGAGPRGLHPDPGHARHRRAHLRSRRHARRRRSSSSSSRTSIRRARCSSAASRWRSSPIVRNHPGSVNPLIKSNNLLNNALAMQEAFRRGAFEGVMRNYRGELAECTHVEPVHRQERRRADAAARRRPAAGHHARVPVRGRRRGRHPGARGRCCTDDDLFGADEAFLTSTTREVVPIVRVDDRTIGSGVPGPITRALLEGYRRKAQALTAAQTPV